MNTVIVMGRDTKDGEIRYSQSGTAIYRNSVAVERRFKKEGQPEADFFDFVAFNKTAEWAEKYLKKCLNTLVHQTATNYEVLLIDDGSPDNSGKICDSYAGTHGFVYSIRKIRELPGLVKRL